MKNLFLLPEVSWKSTERTPPEGIVRVLLSRFPDRILKSHQVRAK
jgi:hypothetical protein